MFTTKLFQYENTPQYLRRSLFQRDRDLELSGLMNPLDAPHHVKRRERSRFRDGVVMDKEVVDEEIQVNVGLSDEISIPFSSLPPPPPNSLVTVQLPSPTSKTGTF